MALMSHAWNNLTNKCVSKMHTRHVGGVKTVQHPTLFSVVTFPSVIVCLYLLDSSGQERCSCQASKSNFVLLWYDLWPRDPKVDCCMPLSSGKICANLHWNRFIRFTIERLVTDERMNGRTVRRTDERRGQKHFASSQSRQAYVQK